jgi:hypothetical protein
MFEGRVVPEVTKHACLWLVSRAWEQLGRPDSAAAYCALALERSGNADYFVATSITLPFALQRLVLLEAQLGRADEARRHWNTLAALATRPDDEFRPLLQEARTAVMGLRAMAPRKG